MEVQVQAPGLSTDITKQQASAELLVQFINRFTYLNQPATNQENNSGKHVSSLKVASKGMDFLLRKCGALFGFQCKIGCGRCLSPSSPIPVEIFSSGVIYDLLHDSLPKGILDLLAKFLSSTVDEKRRTYNFFKDRRIMPDDVDTTSVVLWALLKHGSVSREEALIAMKHVLKNTNSSGVIETFFPPYTNKRGQLDVATLANVLRVAYQLGLEKEVEPTEKFVLQMLGGKPVEFENGLYYYDSPDAFHYFLTNCVVESARARELFKAGVIKGLKRRLEMEFPTNYPMDLAMRTITVLKLGFLDDTDEKLRKLIDDKVLILKGQQRKDGSWPPDSFYRYKGWHFGSKELSTAFAVKAITMWEEKMQREVEKQTKL